MKLEPPSKIPIWGIWIMFLSSALGVYLLGWELARRKSEYL